MKKQPLEKDDFSSGIDFETERLIFRNVRHTDIPQLVELANNLSVAEMMNGSISFPYTIEEAENWVSKHEHDSRSSLSISWAIEIKESKQFIGSVQLRKQGSLEIARLSYWIGLPFRNQGFMKEAGRGIIQYGFKELNLKRIEAEHLLTNPASGAVLRSIGFQHSGREKKLDKFSNTEEWFEEYFLGQIT